MAPPAETQTPSQHRHVVLYDGVCGLCNWLVRFVIRRDPDGRFAFAALQSRWATDRLARDGRDGAKLDSVVVVVDAGTAEERLLDRSDAALLIAASIGWPWRAFAVFRIVPRALRDLLYRGVARIRYRLFGKYDSCPVPSAEVRARFVDVP